MGGELALSWVVTTVAVLALVDLPSAREILLIVGPATLAFGGTELWLVRRLR